MSTVATPSFQFSFIRLIETSTKWTILFSEDIFNAFSLLNGCILIWILLKLVLVPDPLEYKSALVHGQGPLLLTWINPAWISNHMPHKVCDEIAYPLPNFNGATVKVWKWTSNSPISIMDVIYLFIMRLKLIHIILIRTTIAHLNQCWPNIWRNLASLVHIALN